jgi:hypothetical protein
MGLSHAALQWLLFGFQDTGSLDTYPHFHSWQIPKNAHAGPQLAQ